MTGRRQLGWKASLRKCNRRLFVSRLGLIKVSNGHEVRRGKRWVQGAIRPEFLLLSLALRDLGAAFQTRGSEAMSISFECRARLDIFGQ